MAVLDDHTQLLREAQPIVWPSSSELAETMGMPLSTFSRLPLVTGAFRRKIGREVRIAPRDAIAILTDRGFSPAHAETLVADVVWRRTERTPGVRQPGDIEPVRMIRRSRFGSGETHGPIRQVTLSGATPAYRPPAANLEHLRQIQERFAGREVDLERTLYATDR